MHRAHRAVLKVYKPGEADEPHNPNHNQTNSHTVSNPLVHQWNLQYF